MPRTLITGGAGQLGSDLAARLGDEAVALDRAALDVTDRDALERAFAELEPQLVLNCTAYNNVDAAESDEEAANAVNVDAVTNLAQLCAGREAKLVHFSTNYVFDGEAEQPYFENDPPNPQSVYAKTKLGGEHEALAKAPGALVIRTAGLYGLAGNASKGGNFVERMLARARSGEPIRMVADQRLTPTFTSDLADWTLQAIEADAIGLLHLTNAGACSWHEFTLAIFKRADLDVEVEAVETTVLPGGVKRPLNGVLAIEAALAQGIEPRGWHTALVDYMDQAGFSAS